jgi:putative heme degradation protein
MSRQRIGTHSAAPDADAWSMPLSLQGFHERIALVAELELPCVLYLGQPLLAQVRRGVIRRIERHADRLNLMGDDFALFLHEKNIDSIWLVQDREADDRGLAVEIYGAHGSPITRILGVSEGNDRAVWSDVMGNPLLALT